MAYDQGFPSLYDLMNPVQLNGYQGMPSNGDVVSPVQPNWQDKLADRMIGTDRYGDLSDQARRRALGAGMMNFGQSLTAASLSPSYQQMAQILSGILPRAGQAFEGALSDAEQQTEHQQDRAFQGEQRQFQRENMAETREDRKNKDALVAESNAAVKDSIAQTDGILRGALATIKSPEKKAILEARWSDIKRMTQASMKAKIPVSMDQAHAVNQIVDDVWAESDAGIRDKIDQQQGAQAYIGAKAANVPVEEFLQHLTDEYHAKIRESVVKAATDQERLAQEKIQTGEAKKRDEVLNAMSPEEQKYAMFGYSKLGGQAQPRPKGTDYRQLFASKDLLRAISDQKTPISKEDAGLLGTYGISGIAPDKPLTNDQYDQVLDLMKEARRGGSSAAPASSYSPQDESAIAQFIADAKAAGHAVTREFAIERLRVKGVLAQ